MTDPMDTRPVVVPGEVLADKYRVERILGRGGMGVVVEATHLDLDERVALKFLLPEIQLNQEAVQRFAREARASVKIKSEHVARTYDVGKLATGCPYMVMELLRGSDLSERLARNGPLPIAEAVGAVLQALDAVAEAHAIGIVHRDLKPANLFVSQRNDGSEIVKVLDFGISKLSGPAESVHMTRTAAVLGSPMYMSPEQMRSAASANARSDIWALGVTLFELLAGRVPFGGESYADVCIAVAAHPLPSVRNWRPDAPPELDLILQRCMAKDPAQRYQHVGELAEAIAPFAPQDLRRTADRVSRVISAAGLSSSAPAPAASASPGPVAGQTQDAAPLAAPRTGDVLPVPPGFAGVTATEGVTGAQLAPMQQATAAAWSQTSGSAPGSLRSRWPVVLAVGGFFVLVAGGLAYWRFVMVSGPESAAEHASGGGFATAPDAASPSEAREVSVPSVRRQSGEGAAVDITPALRKPETPASNESRQALDAGAGAPTHSTTSSAGPTSAPRQSARSEAPPLRRAAPTATPKAAPKPQTPRPETPKPTKNPGGLTDFGSRT